MSDNPTRYSDADFFMCWNKSFRVSYDINPWMTNNIGNVDVDKASHQWSNLESILHNLGAKVDILLIDDALIPDIVFTANAAIIHKNIVRIANFKHSQRQPETAIYEKWFKDNTPYNVYTLLTNFEGAGDALKDSMGNLWCGYGFRTSIEASVLLSESYRDILNIIPLQLINPNFYHLDTCFCPLESGYLLYYPGAFNDAMINRIKHVYTGDTIIEVSEDDAMNFSCNAVEWKNNIIMNKCSPKLNYDLERIGYNVIETDLSEFMKAGGSAKCLTLRLK